MNTDPTCLHLCILLKAFSDSTRHTLPITDFKTWLLNEQQKNINICEYKSSFQCDNPNDPNNIAILESISAYEKAVSISGISDTLKFLDDLTITVTSSAL